MNFSLVLCWSLARALVVSTVAAACYLPVRSSPAANKAIPWWPLIAVAPLLIPDLLIGFTYRLASTSFDFSSVTTELIYGLLLLTKVLSIQVVCRWLVPPSEVSPSSIHLWKLTQQKSWSSRLSHLRLQLSGSYRSVAVGWTLGALWCFQEFETAALLQIEQHPIVWAVWLFDAKVANEPLVNCLMFACPAIAIQGILIAVCLAILKGKPSGNNTVAGHPATDNPATDNPATDNTDADNTDADRESGSSGRWASLVVVSLGFLFTVALPLLWNSVIGIQGLWEFASATMLRTNIQHIAKSTFVAGLSAVGSWMLAKWMFRTCGHRIAVIAVLPGLLSPLVLSLLLLSVFLNPLFRTFYDSLLPLVLTQIVWLLPRAFLLCVAFDRRIQSEQIHSAKLLQRSSKSETRKRASRLIWVLQHRPAWISVTVLLMMAFWEVTISSILHPVSMRPTVCMLYSQMHFGHSEALAGQTALAIVFPLLALALLAQIWKLVRQ